jgi:hypothetical protein
MVRITRTALLLLISLLIAAVSVAAHDVQKTKVTVFTPAVPVERSRSGECWTDSIAVARRGAYRCMHGNEIYDPCFTNLNLSDAVICGANPANGSTGFILSLTKPLPKPAAHGSAHPRPWLVKLAGGTICEIQTGTIAFVAGVEVPYGCSDSQKCDEKGCPYMTGLTDKFERGQVWTADKVAFNSTANGLKLLSRKAVALSDIWE